MTRFPLYFLVLLVSLMTPSAWAYTADDCIKCHKEGSPESSLHIILKEFQASIHGREMACMDCHSGVKGEDHQTMRGSGAVDCGQCHEQKNRHGLQSIGNNRPECHSCHTRHYILEKENKASAVYSGQLRVTCKGCHPVECGEADYLSWLPSKQIASHNKQDFNRAYAKDDCLGCHQGGAAHGEEEILNKQNCYKCHLNGAEQAKLLGYIHPRADSKKQPVIFAAAAIYQIFMVVLLWGGFRFYIRRFSGKSKLGR